MNKVNWGLIGCGKVVETKSGPAFNTIKNSSVYAVMRRNIEEAKSSARKLNAKKYYNSIDDLVNDDNVNAIYIATPPGVHLEQAIKCCQAKKPTYIEKPFARNYKEAMQICEMYKEANVPLFVAHYRRALPRFLKIKEIIDNGEIGKVFEVDFRLNRKYNDEEIHNTWLYNTELSGGGKFYDIAPHSIDILVYLFGKFKEVHGFATNNNKDYKVEDMVVMSFKTDKNVIGTANFNSLALDKRDSAIIYGTKGRIDFSMHGNEPIVIENESGKTVIDIKMPKIIQEPMIQTIVNELLGNGKSSCHGDEALETYRIMDIVLDEYYSGRDDQFWRKFK